MRSLIYLFVLTSLVVAPAATGESSGQMIVTTEAAIVELGPSLPGRRFVRLPELKFGLTIKPSCPANMRIHSVSVSVADSNETFDGKDLQSQALIQTSIVIPRRQASALPVVDFCARQTTSQIRAAYTAALSLRCINEEQESIVYQSVPLNITLHCENSDNTDEPIADQSSSVAR